MDWLGKTLDFIGRYAWAVMIAAAFVLFIPDDAAKQLGIFQIRQDYQGYWWIGLVLTAAIWVSVVFRSFDQRTSAWLAARGDERKRAELARGQTQQVISRLNSLGDKEVMWIKYCLFHNTQTLSAQRIDTVAQSLTYKGILQEGSGHMLDLPFHIRDDVWAYLKENEGRFLPNEDKQNPRFAELLDQFRKGRHAF